MSEGEHYPWQRAIRFVLVAFAVLSLLPVWPAWYFGKWCAIEKPVSFWTMLTSLPRALEQYSASTLVLDYYRPDLILPAVIMCVLLLGRWVAGRLRGKSIELGRWGARFLALCLFLLAALLLVVFGR
jgi:hypothetical protein